MLANLDNRTRSARRGAAVALLATATLLSATACGTNDIPRSKGDQPSRITGDAPQTVSVHTITLPDGATVQCIWEAADSSSRDNTAGGLSCDWANKTEPTK